MTNQKCTIFLCLLLTAGWILTVESATASVTDTAIYVPDELETFVPPAAGESYTDQIFGTAIKRISDAQNTTDAADTTKVLTLVTQELSTVSPFNADNSRLLLQHFSYFSLYDGLGNFLQDLPLEIIASSEPRWSRTDPAVFYYINGNQLKQYDVLTRNDTVVHEFEGYASISGKGGGNLSFDGDHMVLVGNNVEVFVYQFSTDTPGPALVMNNAGDANTLMITPDNNVLVVWDDKGEERFNGIELFDSNMNFQRQVTTVGGKMDVARDADGSEILFWANANESSPDPDCTNGVIKIHLEDNSRSCMVSLDWALGMDISAPQDGDVFYISTHGPSPDEDWNVYQNEVLRVSMDGQEIERLLHHRSMPTGNIYAHPRVSVSRDGSRLVYASNFGLQASENYPPNYTDVYFVCNISECVSPVHEPVPDPEPEPSGPPVLIPGDLETFIPPAAGGSYIDPVFGTNITRLTDARNTPDSTADNDEVLDLITQEYSTMSVFNADNSRMLLQHFSYFALYDGVGNYLSDLPFDISASSEPRWSPDDPALLYYLSGNKINSYHIQTGTTSLVREFPEYSVINSRGEADLSFDGDHLVFFGDNAEIFVYTLSTDSKGPVLVMPNPGDANSLYMTPDNNVLVTWDDSGSARYNGIELYDGEMNFLRQISKAGGHMDVARDTNGDEILLWANAGEVNSDPDCENGVVKIRLADAGRTCLLALGWGMGLHVSAPLVGDSFYVSTHGPSPDDDWSAYQNEILRLSMDGQVIDRLLHHRSKPSDGYYDQPKVSVSRDGSRLVYASNFGLQAGGNYPVDYTDVYFVCTVALCESPELPPLPEPPPPEDEEDPPPEENGGEQDPPPEEGGDEENPPSGEDEPSDSDDPDAGENEPPDGSGGGGNPPPPAPETGNDDQDGLNFGGKSSSQEEAGEPLIEAAADITNEAQYIISPTIEVSTLLPVEAGKYYLDLLYGNVIKRLTDALQTEDQAAGRQKVLPLVAHEYSTISPFNSDNSRLLLQHFSYFALYDGEGNYLEDLPFEINASSEPRWSREDPGVLYFVNGNRLKSFNINSWTMTVIHEFTEYDSITSLGEADMSFDGDHLVLLGDRIDIFVYTISTGIKGEVLELPNAGIAASLYLTPDNNVLVTWEENGPGRFEGIELFDQNMGYLRHVTTAGGHMDVSRDANGDEILLWSNSGEPVTDINCQNGVVKIRLRDNRRTCLLELDWSLGLHISAPEADRDWFIVSTYLKENGEEDFSAPIKHRNEILQVSLDGSLVTGLAMHWSRDIGSYYFQPRAALSADGSRLVFGSNFNLQQTRNYPESYTDVYYMCLENCKGMMVTPDTENGWIPVDDYKVKVFRHQEDDPSLSYAGQWHTIHHAVFSDGAVRIASENSTLSFDFHGTAVSLLGYRGPWGKMAKVTVDGNEEIIMDTYAERHRVRSRLLTLTGLREGQHTLKIEVPSDDTGDGKKWIWIDAIDTYPCPLYKICLP